MDEPKLEWGPSMAVVTLVVPRSWLRRCPCHGRHVSTINMTAPSSTTLPDVCVQCGGTGWVYA